jgi:hypothetical protein
MSGLRTAAVLMWFIAAGFGLPCVWAIRNLQTERDLPMILGFKAYGGGPFERHGISTTIGLLVAFMVLCVLEALAGWLLWRGATSGAVLALVVLPFGAAFWWGFALPIPPLFAVARTALIVLNWDRLGG